MDRFIPHSDLKMLFEDNPVKQCYESLENKLFSLNIGVTEIGLIE